MKVLIVYDSVYGNTEKIAKAIAGGLSVLGEARVSRISENTVSELQAQELILIGSPTQRGRPTTAIQELLDNIPTGALKGVKVAAFDTRISLLDRNKIIRVLVDVLGYAAVRIARKLKKNGGALVARPVGFLVKGTEGPIIEGELERAEKWARGLVSVN